MKRCFIPLSPTTTNTKAYHLDTSCSLSLYERSHNYTIATAFQIEILEFYVKGKSSVATIYFLIYSKEQRVSLVLRLNVAILNSLWHIATGQKLEYDDPSLQGPIL